MFNILTIDLEDYFQVYAFSDVIKFDDWGTYECRIQRNTDRLLNILSSSFRTPHSALRIPVKATFFVLGWIAERYPSLIRRIQKEGHEIACHGYAHKLIYTQSREEFRQDIKKSKAILEGITGSEVMGFRAPNYSITNKSQWAFEVLAEEGFKYDSSIFPIRHDFYGMPDAPRFPFLISLNGASNVEFSMLNVELNTFRNSKLITQNSQLLTQNSAFKPQSSVLEVNSKLNTQNSKFIVEVPLSTVKLFGQNVPISGGGYFRLFPYSIIRKGLKSINEKENKPFIFYLHPWELDFEQPRIKEVSLRSRFRHYVNLNKTEFKFKRLLSDFQFSSIKEILGDNSSTE
jgi:polysaccharide deacetylase family protein (PEP-CTERM system associated)